MRLYILYTMYHGSKNQVHTVPSKFRNTIVPSVSFSYNLMTRIILHLLLKLLTVNSHNFDVPMPSYPQLRVYSERVSSVTKSLKFKSVPGPNQISKYVPKQLPLTIINLLTKILNKISSIKTGLSTCFQT